MLRAPGTRGWALVRLLGLAAVALATLAQARPVVAQSTDLKWRRTPAATPAPIQYSAAQNSAPRAGGTAATVANLRSSAAAQEPGRLPVDHNIHPVQAAEEMPAPRLPELPISQVAPAPLPSVVPSAPAVSPAPIPSGARPATRDPFDDGFPETDPRSTKSKTPIAPQNNPSVLRQPKPRTAMVPEAMPVPPQYSNTPQKLLPPAAANPIHGEPELVEESIEMYGHSPGGCQDGQCGPGCDGNCGMCGGQYGSNHPILFGLRKFIRGTLLCVAGGCDPCDDGYFGCGPSKPCNLCWDRDLSFHVGAQGFQSPLDGNQFGNYGFYEGLNYGGAFWDAAEIGYQLGGTAMQTTYDEGVFGGHDRQQYFITGGFFHREMCGEGLQYGAVYDYLFDNTDESVTLGQIRGELSYVNGGSEVGFMFAEGMKQFDRNQRSFLGYSQYETVNQYALFYRIRTFGNGDARLWGGVDDNSHGLFGADFRAPINDALALTATFNYLSSDTPANADRNGEGWNFGIGLVYYPGSSVAAGRSPYRPLFNVADNGTMMQRGIR
jgi:hypothetical protein